MYDIEIDGNRPKNIIPWLHNPPDERRCKAMSKRSGVRCKRLASRGKAVCKFHGGRSTGPIEPAIKHGYDTLEALKQRSLQRFKVAAEKESSIFKCDIAKWLERRLKGMDYTGYRRIRPAISDFVAGVLSARKLIKIIEGNPYHQKNPKVVFVKK